MSDLIFEYEAYRKLYEWLFKSELETCAILRSTSVKGQGATRLLVNYADFPPDDAYADRTGNAVQLKPEYIAPIVKKAKIDKQHLIFVHTHPFTSGIPSFSPIDDLGEKILLHFLNNRKIAGPHVALLMGPHGSVARELGQNVSMRVIRVGSQVNIISDIIDRRAFDPMFDRQIRAFGTLGQSILGRLKIGIVGVGGTGTHVIQQLAHLGVEDFLLIDPDVVELSNLNRLVGATTNDVDQPKVSVAERTIQSIRSNAVISAKIESVLNASTARLLVDTDFFFCCTDSHGSRAVLNQVAYQYLLPCIDMGVSISSTNSIVTHVTGRVQMLAPGLPCLVCGDLLDPDKVRYDLMTPYQRQSDPYFLGEGEPEPAVISLNATMASLAVTMFLGAVLGIPAKARYQIYNGINGQVRSIAGHPNKTCVVCSKLGSLAKGDTWPLPARTEE